MSYTSVFGGTTIYPSDVSYLPLALSVDTTLDWPLEASGDVTVAARIIGVTPASAGLSVIMPDATRTGTGQSILFNNMGPSHSFLVKDDAGNTLATVTSGTQWQIYLTDNTTAAGTWEVYQMGASTATVQASALAGPGLTVVGSQLAQAALFTQFTSDASVSTSNRALMYVYTGTGAATLSLPAAASAGDTFFVRVRNQGAGVLVIHPAGMDRVNGATGLNLAPEDSAMIVSDGQANWYTVGLGQNANFTFDFVSIPVTGGTYTLSAEQLNRIAYRFTGDLSSNLVIIVPETVQQYWVDNQTSGNFSLGLKTTSQASPTPVNQNASAILYCDGQNVVLADTSTIGLPVGVAQGGTGATTPSGARANLGISQYADPLVTAVDASAAQSVLFPDPITDGQMLIGNAATPGFAQTTLTAGTGIGVLNGPGSVTIVNTGAPAPGSVYSQIFSGTGSQVAFTLAYQPFAEDNTQVYVNGVYQQKDTYSLSGSTITFNTAPPLGTNNIGVVVIQVVPIGVTNANLVNYNPAFTGAVAETVQSKLEESVSVRDFGAVGNSTTDDTAAIQAALNYAAPLGYTVYFPPGTYRTTATVGFRRTDTARFGVRIVGSGTQYTTILADHNSGPVLALNRSNALVQDITLSASAARTAGAAGTTNPNCGLLMEAPDTASAAVAQMAIIRTRVISQPSHGIVHVGLMIESYYEQALCQSNLGHGFVFDGGQMTARVNQTYPGLVTLSNCWATSNVGHGLKIGDPNDTQSPGPPAIDTLPVRFLVLNFECSSNAATAGKTFSPATNATSTYSINNGAVTGTAQGGTSSSVTLAAGASSVDNAYVGMAITITGGTGSGQTATITAYNGTTKVATIGTRLSADEAWVRGYNMTFDTCAMGRLSGAVTGCIRFAGENLQVRNQRAVTTTHTLRLELDTLNGGGGLPSTRAIVVDGLRVLNNAQNPAIIVSDLANTLDITANTYGVRDNITQMFTTGAVRAFWNLVEPVASAVTTTTQSVNNTTTLVDATELAVYLRRFDNVFFEAVIRHSGNSTANIKLAFNAPGSSTIKWDNTQSIYVDATGAVTVSSAEVNKNVSRAFGANADVRTITIRGWVEMTSTSGPLQLRFAQNTATAVDTSILPGSTLRVLRANTNE